jgi:hypothetical protein
MRLSSGPGFLPRNAKFKSIDKRECIQDFVVNLLGGNDIKLDDSTVRVTSAVNLLCSLTYSGDVGPTGIPLPGTDKDWTFCNIGIWNILNP